MIEENNAKRGRLEWDEVQLPNLPLYRTKLTKDITDRLWTYINKAYKKHNHTLAGNISASFQLVDEDDWFFKYVVEPISKVYLSVKIRQNMETYYPRSKSLMMSDFWVNFQNKHEFNPLHMHSGVLSFVIWMKIPTKTEEQHNLPICKHSNFPCASDFQFVYSDITGHHQDVNIHMDEQAEGCMMIFPATLRHQVYPFYENDGQRVSISGNVSRNSLDLYGEDGND